MGNTTNYNLPYPVASDLAKNGYLDIQNLAQAVEDLLDGSAAEPLIRFTSDVTSTSQTTNSTSWVSRSDLQASIKLGPSGKFAAFMWVAGNHPTSGQATQARIAFGGAGSGSSDEITLRNTANVTGSVMHFGTGTAGGTLTATLNMQVTTATTGTIANGTIWLVALG